MCLCKVKREKVKLLRDVVCWKVMRVQDGKLTPEFYHDVVEFKIGELHTDPTKDMIAYYCDSKDGITTVKKYTSGFHAFATKEAAIAWGVSHIQVLVKCVIPAGTAITIGVQCCRKGHKLTPRKVYVSPVIKPLEIVEED